MKSIFLKPSDPLLKKVAKEVSKSQLNSSKIKIITDLMFKTIKGEQIRHKKGVGLAAPQIGIFKRIILVDVAASKKGPGGNLRVYMNPEITWQSKREGEWYEGCYSTGNICGIVSRPKSIKIKGLSLEPLGVNSNPPPRWDFVVEKYTGYTARIFQHEIDHLNGKVFIDRIKNPDHLHLVEKKDFPLYRNKQAWRNWPKKCSFKKWQQIKSTSNDGI